MEYLIAVVMFLGFGVLPVAAADDANNTAGPSLGTESTHVVGEKIPESVKKDDLSIDGADEKSADEKSADEKSADEKSADEKSADAESTDAKSDDAESTEKKPATEKDAAAIGEPLASGMIKLIQDEVVAALKRRGVVDRFARFQSYAAGRVSATAGKYTGSELTGNCRIRWYDQLMRNVPAAPSEAEQFTRALHAAALNNEDGLAQLLPLAAAKMDVVARKPRSTAPASAQQALDFVKQSLTEAQVAYCAAVAPLSKGEIRELEGSLATVLATQNQVGHTLADRGNGRRLCDLMEKMDRSALYAAAEALAPLADARLLEQIKSLPDDAKVDVSGVVGHVAGRIHTPAGTIVIGGNQDNTYQLDQMGDVAAVIDLGGNDTYMEGTVGTYRPVLVVMDLGGNDAYRGSKPGIQGAAILGISMLVDAAGDDVYQARDIAQGTALGGVGMLIDCAGKDRYVGVRRVQGTAVGGLGLLIDRAGTDDYHAALWAQGVGGPLGFGMLDDVGGNDHYYCGGMWRNSYYPETPGYEGWGQGVGGGIRQVASGGIGVIFDGAGDDVYEFDYLSHGGGYWCGLGFARDFGGNDQRLICRAAYDGSPRTQTSFQRFGCGWGCHYSLGFLLDDAGDDVYEGTIMGTGMAWDCSFGALLDFAGNDQYKATGGLTQGTGAQMGFGILFDYRGEDVYQGYGQGHAPNGISYHDLPRCGGNFSFMIDYGGKDKYGCGAQNNSYIQRGDQGGFLIDRPGQDETEPTAKRPSSPSVAGS
jgi:hypothetical protein